MSFDGSADPPGDRLDAELLFGEGEDEAVLEARAFVVPETGIVPVKSRGVDHRDAQGHFLLIAKVNRAKDSFSVAKHVVVPYADLDLSPGTHRIGYEITVRAGGQVCCVRATRLTLVEVSTTVRKVMEQPAAADNATTTCVLKVRTRGKLVNMSGIDTRGFFHSPKEGKFWDTDEKRIHVQVQAATPSRTVRTVPVNIPGGFTRRAIVQEPRPPRASDPPDRADLASLKGRAWVPLSQVRPPSVRVVYFATNRVQLPREAGKMPAFGAEIAGDVTWGSCRVNIPVQSHTMFNNLVAYAIEAADQVTYYCCSTDAALQVSQRINYYEPIGLLPYFEKGIDTINADGTGTSFLMHDYYASTKKVLTDIQITLTRGLPPDKRMPPLASRIMVFRHPMWSFTPIKVKEP